MERETLPSSLQNLTFSDEFIQSIGTIEHVKQTVEHTNAVLFFDFFVSSISHHVLPLASPTHGSKEDGQEGWLHR